MYLAPLNYDRFFKKVFKDLKIAKVFIEDFLEVEIESIEALDTTARFTDNASIVEFDYRCKIEGQYIIIDMQQWYKPDITQRFFLYHALNTGLQLETLPQKKLIIDRNTGKAKEVKDYRRLEPVSTLIWMVQDNLGFKENYMSYRLLPHTVVDFLKKNELWKQQDIKALLEKREEVLEHLKHTNKDIDFLPKNSLIFMFQKNIVKDEKIKKYHRWFEFAEMTRNEDNIEEDFEKFRGDEIFEAIIKRIDKSKLKPDDMQYIDIQKEDMEKFSRWEEGVREQSKRQGKIEGEKEKAIKAAIVCIKKGYPTKDISEITGLTEKEIDDL
jgi:predicted small secreted protein